MLGGQLSWGGEAHSGSPGLLTAVLLGGGGGGPPSGEGRVGPTGAVLTLCPRPGWTRATRHHHVCSLLLLEPNFLEALLLITRADGGLTPVIFMFALRLDGK